MNLSLPFKQNVFDEYFENVKSFCFCALKMIRLKRCLFECFSRWWNNSISLLLGLSNVTFFSLHFCHFQIFQWKFVKIKSFRLLFAFHSFECLLQQSTKIWPFIKTYDVGNCLIKLFIWIRSFGCFSILKTIYDPAKEFHMVFFSIYFRSHSALAKSTDRTSFPYKIEQKTNSIWR